MSYDVAVFGLGKLGLPVAVQYALSGLQVIGVDVNPKVVELINSGFEPFPGEVDLASKLVDVVKGGRMRCTTNGARAVAGSSTVVVMVPVVVDSALNPDFINLDNVVDVLSEGIQPGTLVILETTVPVGTTRQRVAKEIEARSGLVADMDFMVAFSPERVLTGRVFADLRRYPKVVGGIGPSSASKAKAFYMRALSFDERPDLARENGVWDVGSAEAAELVKLAETTYRDVNIALANTFALFAESVGLDVEPIIEAANSQSFSHIHSPGVAVGGHCIPVYPHLYLSSDPGARLVAEARAVNKKMPKHAVRELDRALGSLVGQTVVVLGASYRGGVKETAFSGVWDLVREITDFGGLPVVFDPMFSDDELRSIQLEPYVLGRYAAGAIVQADHPEFEELCKAFIPGLRAIYDGRRILDPTKFEGVELLKIGSGIVG